MRFPLFALVILAGAAQAGGADICRQAAARAATQTGVPYAVLLAITEVETGRGEAAAPWPWTINEGGPGYWLDSRAAAAARAAAAVDSGRSNFDLGCFQLNYRWHGMNFASVDAMLDPDAGALYAARLLGRLFAESGDWSVAAGAYHSRAATYATRYRARFDARLAQAVDVEPPGDGPVLARTNAYPLLQAAGGDQRRAPGSLVPLGTEG